MRMRSSWEECTVSANTTIKTRPSSNTINSIRTILNYISKESPASWRSLTIAKNSFNTKKSNVFSRKNKIFLSLPRKAPKFSLISNKTIKNHITAMSLTILLKIVSFLIKKTINLLFGKMCARKSIAPFKIKLYRPLILRKNPFSTSHNKRNWLRLKTLSIT